VQRTALMRVNQVDQDSEMRRKGGGRGKGKGAVVRVGRTRQDARGSARRRWLRWKTNMGWMDTETGNAKRLRLTDRWVY
jgi:hypothetical protein